MNLNIFLIQLKNDLWNERLKFLILLFLYLFQAITSIITTFYMEDLLALLNFDFVSPFPATGEVALLDFFSDQILFGIFIMSLGTMNIYAGEIENNSISYSLTRPISRTQYTSARMAARMIALIVPLILATIIGWVYMAFIFETFPLDRLIWSLLFILLLFVYLGTVTSLLSTRLSSLSAGLGAIALYMIQFTLSIFEPIELLSPFATAGLWRDFLIGAPVPSNEVVLNLVLLLSWISVSVLLTIHSLKTRDL